MTNSPGFLSQDIPQTPTQPSAQDIIDDGFDEGTLSQFNAARREQCGYVWHVEQTAPGKQKFMRRRGEMALVILVLVAVRDAVGLWAGQKLWQTKQDALFVMGEHTTSARPMRRSTQLPLPLRRSMWRTPSARGAWPGDRHELGDRPGPPHRFFHCHGHRARAGRRGHRG